MAPILEGKDTSDRQARVGKPVAAVEYWRILLSSMLIMVSNVVFIVLFSDAFGFGSDTYNTLSVRFSIAQSIFAIGFLTLIALYLLDFSYWDGTAGVYTRRIGVGFALGCFIVGATISVERYTYLPAALYVLGLPMFALFLSKTLFHDASVSAAITILGIDFGLASVASFSIWFVWVGLGNMWNTQNREIWSDAVDCDNRQDWKNESEGGVVCLAAFMLWFSPLVISAVSFFYCVSMLLLARSVRGQAHSVQRTAKLFSAIVVILLLMVWSAASIGGGGMRLANSVMAFVVAGFIALILVAGSAIGWQSLSTAVQHQPIVQQMKALGASDWVHAMFIFLGGPPFVVYLLMSVINQAVRKLGQSCKKLDPETGKLVTHFCKEIDNEEERQWRLTSIAHNKLEAMRQWEWTSVLLKIIYLGIFAWCFKYGTTLTYMGLAYVIKLLKQGVSCGGVCAIFFFLGEAMFLIPVVPGIAVYLGAGVLIPPTCWEALHGDEVGSGEYGDNEYGDNGFWMSVVLAASMSYVMKIVAHVLQQKMFGEMMSGNVGIRAAVGVNSGSIKAIKYVLTQPGISLPKVCILCGGPDWPTSVLCGILKLRVLPLCAGLTPMFVLVTPTVMAGAFQLRAGTGGIWTSVATVMLVLCSLIQLGAGVLAAYFIDDVRKHKAAELAGEGYEDDEDVKLKDQEVVRQNRKFNACTQLDEIPRLPKFVLCSGCVVMTISAYMLLFNASACFEPFNLSDNVDDVTCGVVESDDCPRAAVKKQGWVALAMLFYGSLCLWAFMRWAGKAVAAAPDPPMTDSIREEAAEEGDKVIKSNAAAGMTPVALAVGGV